MDDKIKKLTFWGMITNIILAFIKIFAGTIVHSMALIADGIHSFSDLLTDFIVLISCKAGHRPPDINHPYGHGKYETVGSILIGFALVVVGGGIGWEALMSLYHHKLNFPGPIVVIIASVSVIAKEILFRITRKTARKIHSSSLYANAWHHRSDALSSLAVIVGGVLSLAGYGYGDHLAGLVVGMMIIAVAGKIVAEAIKELLEHAADEDIVKAIEEILNSHDEICQWHKLRTRKIGYQLFIDVHILVDQNLSVQESHKLTVEIERQIAEKINRPLNVLIHVEPCH